MALKLLRSDMLDLKVTIESKRIAVGTTIDQFSEALDGIGSSMSESEWRVHDLQEEF